jgi:multidrug transporter EmrE-like cation transporter
MSMFSPSVIIMLLVSIATQVTGAILISYTKGLTAPLPTIGMFLGFGVGIGLLARLVGIGVNLSIALPLVASAMLLSAILFGVAVLGESASFLKILFLVGACGLVLAASYMR